MKAVAQMALCPSLDSWKEQVMNLTGVIEELRAELQEIEDAIRSLERSSPLSTHVRMSSHSQTGKCGPRTLRRRAGTLAAARCHRAQKRRVETQKS